MKIWGRFLAILSLMVACFVFTGQPQAQALDLNFVTYQNSHLLAVGGERRNVGDDKLRTEFGKKVDLNNSAIIEFRQFRGFYPKLASKIIQNAPYEKVEDVLKIPDLTERQKERLQANLDNFTVTPPASVFIEGDERYNPGVY
jgi:photosystem II PsbU protein